MYRTSLRRIAGIRGSGMLHAAIFRGSRDMLFAVLFSELTSCLQRRVDNLSRSPSGGADRSAGCPKREQPDVPIGA